jgi:hypothetical protein
MLDFPEKSLPETNTLAYFAAASMTTKKFVTSKLLLKTLYFMRRKYVVIRKA